MDLEWETAAKLPAQGDFLYIEQVSPTRAFIGEVILVWLNEYGRQVICVRDGANSLINLAEDDRWVQYNARPVHKPEPVDVEILKQAHECPICLAPLLEDNQHAIAHPWLWDL